MGFWLFLGSMNALLAVAAGAYGWHRLGGDAMFTIASDYHMYHALGMLAVAWLASERRGGKALTAHLAGAAFMLGIVLFSGTLYAFALTGHVLVAGAAPAGGFLLMIGWLLIAVLGLAAVRRHS